MRARSTTTRRAAGAELLLLVEPPELLLPGPDVVLDPLDELVLLLLPDRFVPETPALLAPPTMPIKASTWHRTTVFEALSREPFSTTGSNTSPKSTSQTSSAASVSPRLRKAGR